MRGTLLIKQVVEKNYTEHQIMNLVNYAKMITKVIFLKIEMDEGDDIYNSVHNELKYCQNNDRPSHTNSFDQKFQKFSDKELMKQYIEIKEKKEKMEQNRHKEIMQQLHKINQTLLEIKSQGNVYKKA